MTSLHALLRAGLVLAAISFALPVAAQPEIDLSRQQRAIEELSFMVGEWRGDATMSRGQRSESCQSVEKIGPRLDGTLLLIEGRCIRAEDDGGVTAVHDALAAIWFDEAEDRYRMQTFVPGHATEVDFESTEHGFVWGFDTPGGRVRYTAIFTDDTWAEHGEFSRDGETWMPFLEMTLKRSESSS